MSPYRVAAVPYQDQCFGLIDGRKTTGISVEDKHRLACHTVRQNMRWLGVEVSRVSLLVNQETAELEITITTNLGKTVMVAVSNQEIALNWQDAIERAYARLRALALGSPLPSERDLEATLV